MSKVIQPLDVKTVDGNVTVELKWRGSFSADWNSRYARAQNRLAHDVLELSEPYIPKRSGYLISTGEADGENGIVRWTAPYAKHQYYLQNRRSLGIRGSFWVEKMKQANQPKLVANVKAEFQK